MSLSKEIKIRILESFYSVDYVLFGKPFKYIRLKEDSECDLCNQILIEEYLSAKGALLGTIIEMYKLINHNPPKLSEQVNNKILNKMACESAKIARKNASILIKTPKGRKSIKNNLIESITENKDVDIQREVESHIQQKVYSLALDNLLISRAVTESENYKEMDSWMGRIVEDAYKILRSSLIETVISIRTNMVTEQDSKKKLK